MWKVLPKLGVLKILLLIFSALFLAVIILMLSPNDNAKLIPWSEFGSAFELTTPVTIIFLAFIYILGTWGWLLFWKLPLVGNILNRYICPNLNGVWIGQIESNYLDEEGNKTIKNVELRIKADLFGFNISQYSLDGYQNSKVIQSEITKDSRTGTFYISYIYEGVVPIPEETDDRIFDGAGRLEVIFADESTTLKGTYWTNRAWQRRQNTAGIITVTKTGN
jgi:hypothetical protein